MRNILGVVARWAAVAAVMAGAAAPGFAADAYPSRPVHVVIGFEPGGSVDIVGRMLAEKLGALLGQTVVIDNRPGAESNIANQFVARAAPDGYTLLLNTGAVAINASLYKNVHYDPVRDFKAVSMIGKSSIVLVSGPAMPVTSFHELLEATRANPGKYNYSSAGGPQLVAAELYKQRTHTSIVRIPYKGGAPAINAVIAGDVHISFSNIPTVVEHAKSGQLRILALADEKRSPVIPDVPTFKEQGIDMNVALWYGLFAPAGTPQSIIDKLASAVAAVGNSPDFRKKMANVGAEVVANTPAEFGQEVEQEVKQWAEVVKASGASVQ